MTTPSPIGPLRYNQPRGVRIVEPEHPEETHSAIFSGVHLLVNSQTEANAILSAYPVIMQATADKAQEILDALRAKQAENQTKE
jgi:hypothetical protein